MYILGGLAIAVPGELRAYQAAFKRFGGGGNVTWKQLFEPTINLSRNGYMISAAQAAAIAQSRSYILADPTLRYRMIFFS